MNQLPAQRPAAEGIPSLPTVIGPSSGSYSAANRRTSTCCPAQRAYPWLLFASTAIAALFCLLYITKPVIVPAPAMIAPVAVGPVAGPAPLAAAPANLMPGRDSLPGESGPQTQPVPSDPREAMPGTSSASEFEETNLRIQHILTAEAPGGNLDRIILDVPVLYQSRRLRWTADEVAAARGLLVRLMDYQERCQILRSEGVELLDAWNRVIEKSIPITELRADSPSLPANQQDAAGMPRPSGMTTTDSIHIQPAGK